MNKWVSNDMPFWRQSCSKSRLVFFPCSRAIKIFSQLKWPILFTFYKTRFNWYGCFIKFEIISSFIANVVNKVDFIELFVCYIAVNWICLRVNWPFWNVNFAFAKNRWAKYSNRQIKMYSCIVIPQLNTASPLNQWTPSIFALKQHSTNTHPNKSIRLADTIIHSHTMVRRVVCLCARIPNVCSLLFIVSFHRR